MTADSTHENSKYEHGSWTPHIYDNQTFVRNAPSLDYYKIGRLVIAYGTSDSWDLSGISTMFIIKNLPAGMHYVMGGSLYIAAAQNSGANIAIQGTAQSVYFRPNQTSTTLGGNSPGWVSFMIIGITA